MKRLILLAIVVSAPAAASSSAAWAEGDRAARAACIKVSGLRNAAAAGPVHFSDRTAQSVLLVRGIYPQRFMKGAVGKMLCLYDRRSRTAEVAEVAGWSAR